MGRGQRHSKNAGIMGSEALTYHERKALGFGTVKERVGKVGQYLRRAKLQQQIPLKAVLTRLYHLLTTRGETWARLR